MVDVNLMPTSLAQKFINNNESYKYCFGEKNKDGEVKTHNFVMKFLNKIIWYITGGQKNEGSYSSDAFLRSFDPKPSNGVISKIKNYFEESRLRIETQSTPENDPDGFWKDQITFMDSDF